MPFTLSHPAAVIPLLGIVKHPAHALALVIGSLAPDFAYYVRDFRLATFAHTLTGSVLVCAPSSLLVLAAMLLLRHRILFLLPFPHREAMRGVLCSPISQKGLFFAIAGFWAWIGSLTHIGWDAFTHRAGAVVTRFPMLSEPLFHINGIDFPPYYVLQHASTLIGLLVIGVFYWKWIARPKEKGSFADEGEKGRYSFWISVLLLSLVIGLLVSFAKTSHLGGFLAFRSLIFHCAVISGGIFAFFTITSLIVVGFLPRYKNALPLLSRER